MPEPQVSIIIPVFEMPEALANALQSIAAQFGVQFEVIVCDGGQDASTLEVLEQFEALPIRHSRQNDTGVYDAMNRGLELAIGEWLFFLGADDCLAHANALSDLLAQAEAHHAAVCGSVKNLPPRSKGVPEIHTPKWGMALLFKNTLHHQGCLYRRSSLEGYRYPENLKVLGDYHLNLWLYGQGATVKCLNGLVCECASGGLSKRFKTSLYREEWWLKRRILPWHFRFWQPLWLMAKYLYKNL